MLKGVNKLIIEVNNPQSEYFERAIFFIKPGKGSTPPAKLADNAEEVLIKNGCKPPQNAVHYGGGARFFKSSIMLLGAAGTGAFIYSFVSQML